VAGRVGVIDIGTNSTRLLVAEVEGATLRELDRRSTVTRLGEGLEASGRLSDAAIQRVTDTIARYRQIIDREEADKVVAVATSAMRDAQNGEDLRRRLETDYGVIARTISGDEEARLTFLGATAGREHGETLVIDIGGGSTEYVVGPPGRAPGFHVSTRMGSVRHTERHLHHDPPQAEELHALAQDADAILAEDIPAPIRDQVERAIAVAGTATSLAAIDLELDPYDPDKVHGHRLDLDACESLLRRLAAKTLEERRNVTGLHPDRAPTIVAGVAILIRSLHAFGLREVEVSEHDILHGAALQAAERAQRTA
jgi:exopolyphosphatase/guanosine-5'-triphosphate,3'-diphosphate pyrophosphatase